VRDTNLRAKSRLGHLPLPTTLTTQQSIRRIVQVAEKVLIKAAQVFRRRRNKWPQASQSPARWRSRPKALEVFRLTNSTSKALSLDSHHRWSRILISRTIFFKSTIGARWQHRSNRCLRSIAKVAQVALRSTELKDPLELGSLRINKAWTGTICQRMGRWDMAAFLIQLKILKRPTALREAWASNQWWEQWRKITLEMDVQTKFKTLMLTWVQTHQDMWSKTSPSLSKPPLKNAPLRTWTSKTPTMDHQQLKCSKPLRTIDPSQPHRRSTRSSKLPEGTTLCR